MLLIFKDKIQSVQENITTSLRGLKVADVNSQALTRKEKLPVDLNAGSELLHKYQCEWQYLHNLAEENALAAQKVDTQISRLHEKVSNQWKAAVQLSPTLGSLPKLCASTERIIDQIESLEREVESVELSLLELADIVERKEFQERQMEGRFQLAIYSEQRLGRLDSLRAELSEDHRQKVARYEKEFEKKQKERQETFGKAFEEDLATYKLTGTVPTIRAPVVNDTSLEDVELNEDTTDLDKMLDE